MFLRQNHNRLIYEVLNRHDFSCSVCNDILSAQLSYCIYFIVGQPKRDAKHLLRKDAHILRVAALSVVLCYWFRCWREVYFHCSRTRTIQRVNESLGNGGASRTWRARS